MKVRGKGNPVAVSNGEHPGTPFLHAGTFIRGKGLFQAIEHIPPAEMPDEEYPFLLSAGWIL